VLSSYRQLTVGSHLNRGIELLLFYHCHCRYHIIITTTTTLVDVIIVIAAAVIIVIIVIPVVSGRNVSVK
jgi:hypothetical protein